MKFDESRNEEISFKRFSWEKKKTLHDVMTNPNKQKIEMGKKVNILEEYAKRNPNAKFMFSRKN